MKRFMSQVSLEQDQYFMRRCIELANASGKAGDLPFGSIVVLGGEILGEGSNLLQQTKQIDRHAERIALLQAQERLQSRVLKGCTVYTTVEPCPMCSFPIRELHISRVVSGLRSPVMGGYTRFGVLQDTGISDKVLGYFGVPPEIVEGVLRDECMESWKVWAPEVWDGFVKNGVLD